MRLTEQAHHRVAEVIGEGDLAVDATAGNGHDTLWLARCVGARGHVWALDVQPEAIASTRARLEQAGMTDRVSLIEGSHAEMQAWLAPRTQAAMSAVMFNLGYLPGSDKAVVTLAETTLPALEQGLELLRPGGIITLMIYRGHEGGQSEWRAIREWLEHNRLPHEILGRAEAHASCPVLVVLRG